MGFILTHRLWGIAPVSLFQTWSYIVSFNWDVALCHVILKSKEIAWQMAPRVAVDNIPNLLVSINYSGSQGHVILLAADKKFDEYLEVNKIKQPVVVLSSA